MALTAATVVDLVSQELHGWGISQDRVTSLTAPIGVSDATFTVNDVFGQATGITPGVVEIDAELLYVTTLDQTTKVCTLDPGFGRGFSGTVAATHAVGSKVTSRPKFPRGEILREVNNVINSVYPKLFAVKTQNNLVVTYPSNSYTLAGSPEQILDVQWQDPFGRWLRVDSYQLDDYDQALRIGSSVGNGFIIGRPLRVVWSEKPTSFATEADLFSVSGLPASCLDVLTKGAAGRLAIGIDISRAQSQSVEQSDRSRVVPPNAGLNVAAALLKQYDTRLQSEANSLRRKYTPRIRKSF